MKKAKKQDSEKIIETLGLSTFFQDGFKVSKAEVGSMEPLIYMVVDKC